MSCFSDLLDQMGDSRAISIHMHLIVLDLVEIQCVVHLA